MRRIVEQFVKYPFYANLIIAFLLLAGGVSIYTMKNSFFPERTSRDIYVSVFYPGASPVEMEEGVTSRIEEAVRGLVGIKEITSTSAENSARVEIETTGEINIDEVLMDVKNAVDGISSFPSAAERPIVYKQRNTSMALFMSLSGDVDLMTLKEYGQRIEEDFLNSGKISQVQLWGYPSVEISVETTEENLLRYGITFDEIMSAIQRNNQDVSGGEIRSKEEEILIRMRSRSADPAKIGDIVLRAQTQGGLIRIRDIAKVKKKFANTPMKSYKKGRPVVSLMVSKLKEEDLKEITTYCEEYTKEFNEKDLGVKLELNFSFMEMLKSRLDMLLGNGMMGLVLVVIGLALFLSFRLSVWVAWGIPSAFLAMFIVANQVGLTINMISLFGMILVIGILVDDGIVIAENIFSHFERGKKPMKAAVDGTMEVMPAVITSVSTTVIAFMPLLFLKNQMEAMRDMAFVVIVSLLFSLFEAFFVLPAHVGSRHVLSRKNLDKRKKSGKGFRASMDKGFEWLRDKVYAKMLKWLLDWRYIAIFFPVALFIITGGLFASGKLKSTIFPSMEFDSFDINIAFVPGSGEARTLSYLNRFEKAVYEVNEELLEEHPDTIDYIDGVFLMVGSSFNGQENGAHAGHLSIYPRDLENTGIRSHDIIKRVSDKIGEIPEAVKFSVAGQTMWGKPVSLSLLGRNMQELKAARDFMFAELGKMSQLKDILDNNAMGKQEVRLKLKPKAYFLGLNEMYIANQVRQGFYGAQAQRLQEGRDELRLWVRYPEEGRERLGQMEDMRIKTPKGEYPLTELVDYSLERGPVSIKRYNGLREIRVEADVVDPDASVTDILEQVDREIIPRLKAQYPGIKLVRQGQQKEGAEAMQVVGYYYLIAFLIIVTILMIHFKSFEQPIIILALIPLSFLGAFWGHGLHGKPVSMLSVWGIVALSGVIINDAVVFLSRFNQLLVEEGMKVRDAIMEAGKSRLRPIILTTVTTSVGLFPLILERSFQAQFLIPMAISLAYGVAFGTFFILVFFPICIYILNDIRWKLRCYLHGRTLTREEVEVAVIHSNRSIDTDSDFSGDLEDYRP